MGGVWRKNDGDAPGRPIERRRGHEAAARARARAPARPAAAVARTSHLGAGPATAAGTLGAAGRAPAPGPLLQRMMSAAVRSRTPRSSISRLAKVGPRGSAMITMVSVSRRVVLPPHAGAVVAGQVEQVRAGVEIGHHVAVALAPAGVRRKAEEARGGEDEPLGTRPARQRIDAGAADQPIVARPAAYRVVAAAAFDGVVAVPAEQEIGAVLITQRCRPAGCGRRRAPPLDVVIVATAVDGVGAVAAGDAVVPGPAEQQVLAAAGPV